MQLSRCRNKFCYGVKPLKVGLGVAALYQSAQYRLTGCGKQKGHAKRTVVGTHRVNDGLKVVGWQRLHLIKDDNAIGDVVQLAAR